MQYVGQGAKWLQSRQHDSARSLPTTRTPGFPHGGCTPCRSSFVTGLHAVFRKSRSGVADFGIRLNPSRDLVEKHVDGERNETLLLALSPTCPWCRQSYPFYKTLVKLKELSDHPIVVIASVDTSASAVVQQLHLEAAGVFADSVVALPLHAAGISSVPTVIHLDGQGVVQNVWVGFLDETRQGAVLASIELGASQLIP